MFGLDNEQLKQVGNFVHSHDCSLSKNEFGGKNVGAIGGALTYHFTPTSLGTVCKISCACGEEIDVTDYSW